MSSILNDVKEQLGIVPEYTHFDTVLIMHINSTFMILNQFGVGPADPYMIRSADNQWTEFFGDDDTKLEAVKTYIYMKVRYLWDTPTVGAVKDALEKTIAEFEWRIMEQKESFNEEIEETGGLTDAQMAELMDLLDGPNDDKYGVNWGD